MQPGSTLHDLVSHLVMQETIVSISKLSLSMGQEGGVSIINPLSSQCPDLHQKTHHRLIREESSVSFPLTFRK